MFFERGVRVSARRVVLLVADAVCVVGSFILAAVLRLSPTDGWAFVMEHIPTLAGSCVIFLVVFYGSGMYERQVLTHRGSSFRLPLVAVLVGAVVIILVFYTRFRLHIGRGILGMAVVFVFVGTWTVRRVFRVAVGYGFLSKNTLIVGEGRAAQAAIRLLADNPDSGYKLFGVVTCSRARPGAFLEGVPLLGHIKDLRRFVGVYDIETVIVATSLAREHSVLAILRPLRYAGVEVIDYIALHEELAQEIPLDHIDDEWLMNAALNSSRIHIRQIKRIMDIGVSVAALVLLFPVALLAMLLVRLTSGPPVIYRQRRTGLEGKEYVLLKIRTMRPDAEDGSGAVWARAADRRITRVGHFLRKWRIDEIPQLVNVLRGEMSLVGPRPERPEFVEMLSEAIPFYRERLLVRPGITGWAQVNYPYGASIEAARRKLQYDLYYIKNMSFLMDVLILLRTFRTIIEGLRYSEEDEEETGEKEKTDHPPVQLRVTGGRKHAAG